MKLMLLPDLPTIAISPVEKIKPKGIDKNALGLQDLPKEKDVSEQVQKVPHAGTTNQSVLNESNPNQDPKPITPAGGVDAV